MYFIYNNLLCTLELKKKCFIFIDELQSQTFIEYIYYQDKIPWSSARAVCQSMGGDLAKIDSEKLMDAIVALAEETYQRYILSVSNVCIFISFT